MNRKIGKDIRIKIKLLIGVLGLVILAAILGHEWQKRKQLLEIQYEIEDAWLKNVYITAADENGIQYFSEGEDHYLETDLGVKEYIEKVADIHIVKDETVEVKIKENVVNGKLTRVGEDELEIEEEGIFPFSPDIKVYRIYGGLAQYTAGDLTIGYNDTDFVIEDGQVSACLIVRNETMEYVRVLLRNNQYANIYHSEVSLNGLSDFEVRYGEKTEQYKAGDTVSITMDSEYAKAHKIYVTPLSLTGRMQIMSLERSQGQPVYRGVLEISPREEGFLIVNEALLEEYLYAVLPSEMPSTYEKEALKAQAICARSYAYRQIEASQCAEYGAHIDDSTSYQVYNNCEEKPETTAAVRETAGLVVKQEGRVMDTYYFSTSCGFTTDYKALDFEQSEGTGYLGGTYVGEEPEHSEKTAYTQETNSASAMSLEEEFKKYITSTDYSAYESAEPWFRWNMTIYLEELTGVDGRLKERKARTPEQILTLEDGAYVDKSLPKLGDVKELNVLKRNDGGVIEELLIKGEEASVKVVGEYNVRYVLAVPGAKIERANGESATVSTLLPSAYFVLEYFEGEERPGYRLYGGGYGHGVGMSQNGANDMAKKGIDSETILQYFYKGSQIGEMYEGLDNTDL